MNKNWLIRTKSNYIFGPVSKEKIIELYKNGSIHRDDEICCGNSFWFYVREENFINKFLFENNLDDSSTQVNSCLKDAFEQTSVSLSIETLHENHSNHINVAQNENELKNTAKNKGEENFLREYTENSSEDIILAPGHEFNDDLSSPHDTRVKLMKKMPQDLEATWKDRLLKMTGIILGIVLVLFLFYRKKIMKLILEEKKASYLIEKILLPSKAYAQDDVLKKKNYSKDL